VRTQLIAWNVIALSLLLGMLGVIVRYSVKELMLHSIDIDLASRIRRRPNGPPRPGPGLGDGGPGLMSPGPPDRGRDDGGPPSPGGPPDPNGPRRGMRSPDDQPYRPVILSMEGVSLDRRSGRTQPWDTAAFNSLRDRTASANLTDYGVQSIETVTIDGAPFRLITIARLDPNYNRVILQLPYPLSDVYRALSDLDRALLTLIPIALACASAGGWFLTGRVLGRVSKMTASAGVIGVKDLSQRLPVAGDDEFSELATTFNGMLGRLESVFKQQERVLEQQRQFTADASHELKTPLTIIKGNTSLALNTRHTEDEYRLSIAEIDGAANTMSQLVQDLLLLARSDSGMAARERVDVPVEELIQEAVRAVKLARNVNLSLNLTDSGLCVHGNQNELVRVLKNLLDNAVQYSGPEGRITVSARREGAAVAIEVIDNGIGISAEHLAHLGERFYRADRSRTRPTGGTGLGLSICKGIVAAHNGSIRFASQVGKGTAVTVTLPASDFYSSATRIDIQR